MEISSDEFRLPFFKENGFVRKLCPGCGLHYWTQNPEAENCGDAPCVDYTFIGEPPTNKRLTVSEMRELFLAFFEDHNHRRISPYPVIARWRDDLMVTIASIVDFQPYVTEGVIPPPANPLVVSQPCLRFEDIDLVGHTAGRHLTVFEMGGHHAFNYKDRPQIYWKDETVRLHHELLTSELGVPSEMVTYKEGLWSGGGNAGFDLEGCVCGLEIDTLVFMMYRVVGDRFEPMPIKVVDTGYGMERWSWLTQGSPSAFHAIYGPVLDKALGWAGIEVDEGLLAEAAKYSCLVTPENRDAVRSRLAGILNIDLVELENQLSPVEAVYAALDHTKGMAFILSEGVVPSNVREGYLARLLFRRSFRLLRRAELEDKLPDLVEAQIDLWGRDFPQIQDMQDEIIEMVKVEGEKYRDTLKRGSGIVKRYMGRSKGDIPIDQLVEFYDSHGLTPEDVSEFAAEAGATINVPDDFYALVAQRHMRTRIVRTDTEIAELAGMVEGLDKTALLFYDDPYMIDFEAEVLAVVEERYVALDKTAFYAEGGGQISDTGWLSKGSYLASITDVQSVEGVLLHEVEGEMRFRKGDKVKGLVNWEQRQALMRSHTATHLLLGAARRVLGDHAWQAGAQKGIERSRLDISHFSRLTREQVEAIEAMTNQVVSEGRPITGRWMQRNEAEEKYGFRLYQGGVVPGKEIRVVEIEDWDVEACGGTHLRITSETGLVKIINTERVQDGVERLIFSTGLYALSEVQRRESTLMEVAELLGAPLEKVSEATYNTVETVKSLRHEVEDLRKSLSKEKATALLDDATDLNGVKLVVMSDYVSVDLLIELGNVLAELEEGVVAVMFSESEVRVVVKAGDKAVFHGVHAGKLASMVAKNIGGGGGGDTHFGQGGGGDPEKFRKIEGHIHTMVEKQLG